MFIKYLIEKWLRLIITYVIATALLFGVFYKLSTYSESVYRSSFTLNAKNSSLMVSHTLENLFGLIMLRDSPSLAHFIKFDLDQINRIKSAEFDVLAGGFLEVDVITKDTEIIIPFYEAVISFLNTDSILNNDIFYARGLVENEMRLIESELSKLDSNGTSSEPTYWKFTKGRSELEPLINNSSSMNRIFLLNRLNALAIDHHELISVQVLRAPIIPLSPEKTSRKVYFIFCNVIVLCLMFVQYLIYMSKQENE